MFSHKSEIKTGLLLFALMTFAGCVSTGGYSPIDNDKLGGPNVISFVFAMDLHSNSLSVSEISDQEEKEGITVCGQRTKIDEKIARVWNDQLDVVAAIHNEIMAAVRESTQLSQKEGKLVLSEQSENLIAKAGWTSKQFTDFALGDAALRETDVLAIAKSYGVEPEVVTHYLRGLCIKITE